MILHRFALSLVRVTDGAGPGESSVKTLQVEDPPRVSVLQRESVYFQLVALQANALLHALYDGVEFRTRVPHGCHVNVLLLGCFGGPPDDHAALSVQAAFAPQHGGQLHSGWLEGPLSLAASGLGSDRLSERGESRGHLAVHSHVLVGRDERGDGLAELWVVQFLCDVLEDTLKPFSEVPFTWKQSRNSSHQEHYWKENDSNLNFVCDCGRFI